MTARKAVAKKSEPDFDVALTTDGGVALEDVLTDVDFIDAMDTTEDGETDAQSAFLIMRQLIHFMKAIYGKAGYAKLKNHFNGKFPDMWKFTEGKLQKLGESNQAE